MSRILLKILDMPEEMNAVEDLQRIVWPGAETEIVPTHLLVTAAHNGGLIIGAYLNPEDSASRRISDETVIDAGAPLDAELIGFVFGFPGLYFTPDGPRPKHCSHMLAVHPNHRHRGAGFLLKRAQWQMIRRQGLDRITWTYDPLLGLNASLNIARLGAVCSTYLRDAYGQLRDALNAGLPTDRFQVDWWINSARVNRRLSKQVREQLDLAHYLSAGASIINPSQTNTAGLPVPPKDTAGLAETRGEPRLLLVEIPADWSALRAADLGLALEWRLHSRAIFEQLFAAGYLITDFIQLPGSSPRSFYALSDGESTF